MEEIAKVRRVIQKADPSGPHETLLVLDANFGQNALAQVKAFDKAIGVTGLVVTQPDGPAKGGVIAAIARQCPKPIRYVAAAVVPAVIAMFCGALIISALPWLATWMPGMLLS